MDFKKLKLQSEQLTDVIYNGVPVQFAEDEVKHALALMCYNMAENILAMPQDERKAWVKRLPKHWRKPIVEMARAIKETTGQTT